MGGHRPLPAGRRIEISGTVQGVGFRPWVYRLARSAGLSGSVRNDSRGVTIEAFGPTESLADFVERLRAAPPPAASIRALTSADIPAGRIPPGFSIVASDRGEDRQVSIPPDLATCADCRREIFDPADRRFRYPFTNCTNCGPRFTIVLDLPYDRPATTMARFEMCPDCRREYEDPGDRRFHAQPNACPTCGPRLELCDAAGTRLERDDEALRAAARALEDGRIVAVKGLGGFHLMVDARDEAAVERLRRRKHRPEKPLAVMAAGAAAVHRLCVAPAAAIEALETAAAPIALLPRRAEAELAPAVCAGSPYCGVMLPATPLHHLLLADCGFPLVATSGNLSDEPIAIDNEEALARLGGVADLWLMHDRPIARHADDSIVWLPDAEPRALRRARGFAPRAMEIERESPAVLCVGGHLKSTVALGHGRRVFLSQHIGDLETPEAIKAFEQVIEDLRRMLGIEVQILAHDLHPDYVSTRWARRAAAKTGLATVAVQHHHAHLASCLADNREPGTALGVTWDGTGYGPDHTIWGGEFLLGDATRFDRIAHLRPFRLPGGEAAVREPRRVALALLWQLLGPEALERNELAPVAELPAAARPILGRMLERGLSSPVTTSAGRLFDGVASLLGLCHRVSFEGQAAMALEAIADSTVQDGYPLTVGGGAPDEPLSLDWRPTIEALLEDRRRGVAVAVAAARFHNALAAAATEVARRVDVEAVALSGGCFQNRLLAERLAGRLERAGFRPLRHRRVPPNDGGIAFGQFAVAAACGGVKEDRDVSRSAR